MLRKLSLLATLAALLVVAACSTSSSSGTPTNTAIAPPANCNEDDMLECSGGSTGFACQSGTDPEGEDATLACSTPVTAGNTDEYCCFSVPGDDDDSTCQPDDTIACETSTVGYSCAVGDEPTTLDSTLTCSPPSTSDDDGGLGVAEYCCARSGTATGDDDDDGKDAGPPAGCTVDATATCTGDSVGYSCGTGVNPETVDPGLTCSAPSAGANGQQIFYCCFTGFQDPSAGTCQPDDDVSLACASGTFGFSCAAGDSDPTTQDDSLSACSASTTVGDEDDYCCAYE